MSVERRTIFSRAQILEIHARADGRCGICGLAVVPADACIDHITPLIRGGPDTPDNCQLAHRVCNRRKFTRLPSEMAAGIAPPAPQRGGRGGIAGGNFVLRIPESLAAELDDLARDERRSLNGQIVYLIQRAIEDRKNR